MPRKTKKTADAARQEMPAIPKELIDQFVTGPMSAEAVNAASMAFKKACTSTVMRSREAVADLGQRLYLRWLKASSGHEAFTGASGRLPR